VFIQAGQCKAWINTGSGWQRNDSWKPPAVIAYMSGSKSVLYITESFPAKFHFWQIFITYLFLQ
jgi:hypothetical protein